MIDEFPEMPKEVKTMLHEMKRIADDINKNQPPPRFVELHLRLLPDEAIAVIQHLSQIRGESHIATTTDAGKPTPKTMTKFMHSALSGVARPVIPTSDALRLFVKHRSKMNGGEAVSQDEIREYLTETGLSVPKQQEEVIKNVLKIGVIWETKPGYYRVTDV